MRNHIDNKEKKKEKYSDLDAFLDDLFGPDDGVEWSEEKHKHFEEVNNRCPISPTRNEWPNIKMHRQRSNDEFKLVH